MAELGVGQAARGSFLHASEPAVHAPARCYLLGTTQDAPDGVLVGTHLRVRDPGRV